MQEVEVGKRGRKGKGKRRESWGKWRRRRAEKEREKGESDGEGEELSNWEGKGLIGVSESGNDSGKKQKEINLVIQKKENYSSKSEN